jgi:hypothetical protein
MAEIIYHSGDLVEVKAPRLTLVFTKAEWVRAIKRGKSVLRNRNRNRKAQAREEKRVALAVDSMMDFPTFS